MAITEQMKDIAKNHPLGFVGTVNRDGTPNVSPKGTMVVLDDDSIIFADIASPGTLANIKERPAMEINFVDIFSRRCFRAKGETEAYPRGSEEYNNLRPHLGRWGDVFDNRIRHMVRLRVSKSSIVVSPAYTIGMTEAELRAEYKAYYASLD